MDMKCVVGPALGCPSVAAKNVVLEPHAKRHCSVAVVASTVPASEDRIFFLDDCPPSDECASCDDEYDALFSYDEECTAQLMLPPSSYWQDHDYPSLTQIIWGRRNRRPW